MELMADAKYCRECANADRAVADETPLANVRERALRSAQRWDELADRAERSIAGSALHTTRSNGPTASMPGGYASQNKLISQFRERYRNFEFSIINGTTQKGRALAFRYRFADTSPRPINGRPDIIS